MDKINPLYLNADTIKEIKRKLRGKQTVPAVSLRDFFSENFWQLIKNDVQQASFKKEKQLLSHSYSYAKIPPLLQEFLHSEEFGNFLSSITSGKIIWKQRELFRFDWKDYTILHDKKKSESGIDIIINFSRSWDQSWGGTITYVDGSGKSTILPFYHNVLSIVIRKKQVNSFVEYVNHHAKKELVFFIQNS